MNREDFEILKTDLVYFDNAATSLKPKPVIDKMNEYYNSYPVNVKRGDYDLSNKADTEYENVRTLVKNFINASNSTTHSLKNREIRFKWFLRAIQGELSY